MSTHIVGMDALDVIVTLAGPGTVIGEDAVPEGKIAVVLSTPSDQVVVTGTPQQLRERVLDGFSLPVPDGVDLFDRDNA